MKIKTPWKRDPRLRLAVVLKVERLTRKIEGLIADELAHYALEQKRIGMGGVRLTAHGFVDQRTKEYKAQKAARAARPPLAVLSPPAPMLPEIGGWPVARLPAGE
jgi:hypothetical protein